MHWFKEKQGIKLKKNVLYTNLPNTHLKFLIINLCFKTLFLMCLLSIKPTSCLICKDVLDLKQQICATFFWYSYGQVNGFGCLHQKPTLVCEQIWSTKNSPLLYTTWSGKFLCIHVQDCGKILAKSVKVFVMFFIIKLWSFQKMIWSYIFTKRIIFHIFSIYNNW